MCIMFNLNIYLLKFEMLRGIFSSLCTIMPPYTGRFIGQCASSDLRGVVKRN